MDQKIVGPLKCSVGVRALSGVFVFVSVSILVFVFVFVFWEGWTPGSRSPLSVFSRLADSSPDITEREVCDEKHYILASQQTYRFAREIYNSTSSL